MRDQVVSAIELLASPAKQLQYKRSVPLADVRAEMVSGFCDDAYHPKSAAFSSEFSEQELKDLAHLYGLLCEASLLPVTTVEELLKTDCWRRVVAVARELKSTLEVER